MKGIFKVILLSLLAVFMIFKTTRVFAVCIPAQCGPRAIPDQCYNSPTEYCLDDCCLPKPTGEPLPTIPSGGSYTYQRCAAGEYLSCGTVAEAEAQNKINRTL